jgi:low affinity Fe/Cu permease
MDDHGAERLSLSDRFSRAAQWTSQQCGRAYTFIAAILIILVWAASGPAFGYSDTWQLIINTGTTIITFLMVFLIQNTQNRDTTAVQLKLDELIRANEHAQNRIMRLEDLTENQIKQLKESIAATGPPEAIANLWRPRSRDLPKRRKISKRQKAASQAETDNINYASTVSGVGEGVAPFVLATGPKLPTWQSLQTQTGGPSGRAGRFEASNHS